ncbi:pole-organizing protein PopZ [Roseibium sp. TrichSKD4]|nr:pole-organizing protein PopZ [Roseibium sp. TrichSKD4]
MFMAEAKQAEEPSMEEILASIRRIISDEDAEGEASGSGQPADQDNVATNDNPEGSVTADDDMSDTTELSQDDLDKLFDMDEIAGDDGGDDVDDMAAAMEEDAAEDEALPEPEPEIESEEEDVLELTEDFELTEDMELSEGDVSNDGEMELVEGLAEDLDSDTADISFVDDEPAPEPVEPDPMEAFEEPEPEPAFEAAPDPDPMPEVALAAAAPPPLPPAADRPVSITDLPDVEDDAPLISNDTGAAVHTALDHLSAMFVGSKAQTVEELIQEMLRPMLKAWLDQHLPGMVEEMVQKEIKRITRGR